MKQCKTLDVLIDGGTDRYFEVGKNGVVSIEDCSIEFPDSVHILYQVNLEDGRKIDINNCRTIAERCGE